MSDFISPKMAREIVANVREFLAARADRARPHVGSQPGNESQENRKKKMQRNRVLVRGRFTAKGLVWDVVKIENGAKEIYAANCVFWEEAVQLACECMRGRTSVSLAGATRSLLNKGAGGMLVPETKIARGTDNVKLIPLDKKKPGESRLIEIRPMNAPARKPPKPGLVVP